MRDRPSLSSFSNVEDLLLADLAIRIQLSPANYRKVVERYKTLNDHLEREGSPLAGLIALLYPQGSVSIGAAIASRLTTDEFDVDVIVQLLIALFSDPAEVLDTLHKAIRGERGSRYYDCTVRRSRCVTVNYADGMHVDFTPMVRCLRGPERQSILFHHQQETPHVRGYHRIANPYGFAEWFRVHTPQEVRFADEYAALAKSYASFDAAQQDPIPEQEDPYRKSMALIVLQLLKRFRNVRYDRRRLRRPPSVMLAKLVADHAGRTRCLSEELLHQAQQLRDLLVSCARERRLVVVRNPVCDDDIFTDRWPGHGSEQDLFIEDLDHLIKQITRLKSGCGLDEMREILSDLFGERPSVDVVKSLADRLGGPISGNRSVYIPSSSLSTGSAALVGLSAASAAHARTTPSHRFFGD